MSICKPITLLVSLFSALLVQSAFGAAPSEHPVFGEVQPTAVTDLPAGMLQQRLESLPAPARQKALR